jgi:DNA-binding CsgD family transcriptional regulator
MDSLRISRLTDRQRLCLRLVHAHLSSKEIATRVGIEPGTVDQHIKAAMLILGVCDRRAAARMLADHEAAKPERAIEARAETAPGIAPPPRNMVDEMLASVSHGLGNLLNFSGRDTREQFRLYAAFLFVMGVASALVFVQTRAALAFTRIYQAAAAHPERSGDFFHWKRNYPELWPQFGDLPLILGLITCLHLALIAAAVARRRHDWARTELRGCLALAVANTVFSVKPSLLLLTLPFASEAVLIYAIVRGGAPERIVVATVVIGTALLFFALLARPFHLGGRDISIFVFDLVALFVLIPLALRANRFWPIWIVGIYFVGLAAHLILLMNPMVEPAAYGVIISLTAPFFLVILLIGTYNHQFRLRQNGVDPAWTPLAQPRRIGRREADA